MDSIWTIYEIHMQKSEAKYQKLRMKVSGLVSIGETKILG